MVLPLLHPGRFGLRRMLAMLFLLALATVFAQAARNGEPVVRIPLDTLGYQPVQTRYLRQGATMYTVHFVDSTHVLVTWHARRLIKRRAEAQPDEQDRNIDALLLELPSGKVLAQTTWQMRDYSNYIWPLGQGRFLIRVRNEFSVIDPLEHLGKGDAFARDVVLTSQRPVAFAFVSTEAEVLTLETLPEPVLRGESGLQVHFADTDHGVQINFYRIIKEPSGKTVMANAGVVRSDHAVSLPVTGSGFLEAKKESERTYLFDFVPYSGKRMELSAYDTTCFPRVSFVSRSEFLAFGCRGADERQQVGFFNLRGEHLWLSAYSNQHMNPSVVSAPAAGRFAIGRTLILGSGLDPDELTDAELTGQEVTIYQAHDGRQLLKVMMTPIQRAGQNFDLSSDGLSFAAFEGDELDIYRLPELTGKDQHTVQEAQKDAPPVSTANVRVSTKSAKEDEQASTAAGQVVMQVAPAAAQSGNQLGDASPDSDAPRARPSLYNADHPKPPPED